MEEDSVYEVKYETPLGEKKLGRPKGTIRPPSLEIRYPIKWRPIYDSFIIDSVRGMSNIAIAKKYEYTPVQVGNVINSPLGREEFQKLKSQVLNFSESEAKSIEEREKRIKEKTLTAMEGFLEDPNNLAMAAPLPYIDKVIKIAALQKAPASNNTNIQVNNQKTLMISGDMAKNVSKALELSREIFAEPSNDSNK